MIRPPQITSRDLVLMTSHYSAVVPDSQSTRASQVIAPQKTGKGPKSAAWVAAEGLGPVTMRSPERSYILFRAANRP